MNSINRYTSKKTWILIFTLAIGEFMGALDVTIVNIALPSIASDFGISTSLVTWVVLIYLIILSSFMLAFGKLGDLKGFKKVFIIGFIVFTIGSFLCGIVPLFFHNFYFLILFRLIQATGAAMISALGAGMIAKYLPISKRGKGLAVITLMAAVGLAIGPFLGGIITQYMGWNWIFLINLPIGILAILCGSIIIPKDEKISKTTSFDTFGAAFLFIGLATGVYAINSGLEIGWTSPIILGCIGLCILSLLLFIYSEKHHPDPLIDLHIFKEKGFTYANLSVATIMMAFAGATVIFPFFFEYVMNLTASTAGIILTAPSIAMIIASPVSGVISDKGSPRVVSIFAAGLMILSFVLFSTLTEQPSLPFILISLFIMGFGLGLFIPANSTIIFSHSKEGHSGFTSSFMMTVQNTGASIGIAVLECILVYLIIMYTGGIPFDFRDISQMTLVQSFDMTFLSGAIICIISMIFCILSKEKKV